MRDPVYVVREGFVAREGRYLSVPFLIRSHAEQWREHYAGNARIVRVERKDTPKGVP